MKMVVALSSRSNSTTSARHCRSLITASGAEGKACPRRSHRAVSRRGVRGHLPSRRQSEVRRRRPAALHGGDPALRHDRRSATHDFVMPSSGDPHRTGGWPRRALNDEIRRERTRRNAAVAGGCRVWLPRAGVAWWQRDARRVVAGDCPRETPRSSLRSILRRCPTNPWRHPHVARPASAGPVSPVTLPSSNRRPAALRYPAAPPAASRAAGAPRRSSCSCRRHRWRRSRRHAAMAVSIRRSSFVDDVRARATTSDVDGSPHRSSSLRAQALFAELPPHWAARTLGATCYSCTQATSPGARSPRRRRRRRPFPEQAERGMPIASCARADASAAERATGGCSSRYLAGEGRGSRHAEPHRRIHRSPCSRSCCRVSAMRIPADCSRLSGCVLG